MKRKKNWLDGGKTKNNSKEQKSKIWQTGRERKGMTKLKFLISKSLN